MADADPGLDDALAELWLRARVRVDARIDVLEEAAAALGSPAGLPDELRDRARTQAHQLAGLLGTLGLPDASPVARRVEGLLTGAPTAADAGPIAEAAGELRRATEAGPTH
ncbi:Hpt domain-containing protein [Patulibacter sp.]|uniref:Hpt domain-containing protein n=1 Tax=Patulibacter sp. TaxID=1912859 RepID=UPI0027247147|nr:Hpt domain-containing protein [Patulibacter sp.]MDO9410469.1 Hpt domain-containing protein [Patulibacter sp.]